MRKYSRIMMLLLTLASLSVHAQKKPEKLPVAAIRVKTDVPAALDSVRFDRYPYQYVGIPGAQSVSKKLISGQAAWLLRTKDTYRIYTNLFPAKDRISFLLEPGDDILLTRKKDK